MGILEVNVNRQTIRRITPEEEAELTRKVDQAMGREPAWCPDCERSTGGACPRHSNMVYPLFTQGGVDEHATARLEERAACEKICEEEAQWSALRGDTQAQQALRVALYRIRARGQK